jgi:AcrR family transcriptional regulator
VEGPNPGTAHCRWRAEDAGEDGSEPVTPRPAKVKPSEVVSRGAGEYLDKETLVMTAANLADQVGWSELTLSEVARAVERHVSSLYTHVESLEDLKREITLLSLDELSEAVWRATLGRVREEALRSIAAVLRQYCEDHPGRAAAIVQTRHAADPAKTSRAERLAEPICATLRTFGLNEEQVFHAHRIFSASIWGFVQGERGELFPEGRVDATFDDLLELFCVALGTGQWPTAGQQRSPASSRRSKK